MPENGVELAAVPPSADTSTGLTDANGGNDLDIDGRIHELSEIISHEMRASRVPRPGKPEIYRVPETFLAADEGAYQPRFLSLGPYHRGDSATEEMRRTDERKLENLDYALQLITVLNFLGYEPPPHPPPAPGCSSNNNGQGNCRPRTGDVISIEHDLMMLENQIPFFVVQRIHRLRYGTGGNGMDTVEELAWRTIKRMMNDAPAATSSPPTECHHLVHLCHEYLRPSNVDKSLGACGDYGRFRRAIEYHEAGVKFRRLNSEADGSSRRPLLDVTFSDGVLRMAQQKVDERTNYILRNVLVYEQRYHDTASSYVTAYVMFMSQLLGGPEDVALLSRRGVIEHHLGDDAEVCALFRGLAQGLVFDPSGGHNLSTVGVRLRSHHRSRLNRWRAWVMRHRFGNPWLAVAWVFGSMAVLGTIVQTVITLLPYVTHQGRTRNVGS
ncbi:hypothetical protein TRIUR3_07052 [Triticum urartu]|uniref:Uncharacterized protein n=1 Tax=Triticum urartu TaxID=4572 RepID=M8AMN9_TRIUA|nr:hypothetical protein TRIUR3_07052 [Triticum urartu]